MTGPPRAARVDDGASMMRRILDRLRTSRAGALYHRLDGTSEEDGRPWMIALADPRDEGAPPAWSEFGAADRVDAIVDAIVDDKVDEAIDEVVDASAETGGVDDARSEIEPASELVAPAAIDPGLVPALNRVADAFERMAESMEVEHREREARLAVVEDLLRELVTGRARPTAVPPVVLGGSIDLETPAGAARDGPEAGPEIDLTEPPARAAKKPAAARRTKRS